MFYQKHAFANTYWVVKPYIPQGAEATAYIH